jgi:cytochrome P450
VIWYLVTNPTTLKKLTTEIRTQFQHPTEITMASVNRCKYLFACIEETLRIYPASPATHQRYVPPGGMEINGRFVPEDTAVGIAIFAAANTTFNFKDPEKFVPERWTGEDPAYRDDKKEALQAFSFGPRNCIGRNLAYVEMKLILARLVWHFDLENCTEGDWRHQKIYLIWAKSPLMIRLMPAKE